MLEHAQVVIIGGGVAGTSIAYHLTRRGWSDVVIVEKGELTSGSTFHSAGLVGQLRSSIALTRMMMYSVELYASLKDDTGYDPGWRQVGSLRLASSPERLQELKRQVSWARTFSLPIHLLSPREAQQLFPIMTTDGVLAAAFLPTDGQIDPTSLTYALAAGARRRGARVLSKTRVLDITLRKGRVHQVTTDRGTIRCEIVVNAAGQWAHEIGNMVGVNVPVVPMSHQYVVTAPISGVRRHMPTMRDPDNICYFREEVGGLVMGGYEHNPSAWTLGSIPPDFTFQLLKPDWERFEEVMEGAIRRVPLMEQAQIIKMINGPEAFTPDGEFILGESEVGGFFVAAGFCAHGIAGAGGVGKVMADWIIDGRPEYDVWRMDVRRFDRRYRSRAYTHERTWEVVHHYYDIHYPFQEREAARPLRLSPAYGRLQALGAVFGEKAGWERPNWIEPNATSITPTFEPDGWARRYWSPAIEAEHHATRQRAALFDVTSFSKFDVTGPGACAFLQHLCANDIDRPTGKIVYTQMLNPRGGIECDLTVTRLADEHFRIITGTAFGRHDLAWIRRHLPQDGSVQVRDVTSQYCCFALQGPLARQILQHACEDDLTNDAFPYMTARHISVGHVPVLAYRVTYVGELGWELYAPMEYGLALWDTLWQAGEPLGMVAGGYRAIDSLRLEKGYRYWSLDITPLENPLEAGLTFAVRLDKPDFIGREALLRSREQGICKRLCCILLDDDVRLLPLGNEAVWAAGQLVGRVTSGGWGFTVGRAIAYAYLPLELTKPGTLVDIEAYGERYPGRVVREPVYDPDGSRIHL
ncbi:MAG: FAD-dependent oxidoreductase [Caldilineae bacterium]|nr:MAG: FAD-dependent oxidoreductase [Caldilineae bacterium]